VNEPRLRLLLIEDSADDADLIVRALRRGGYPHELARADSDQTLRTALATADLDLVITDHDMPSFDSDDVLAILAEVAPDLPCLLVSGKVGEEAVGRAMRQGAVDYVAKDNLWRLPAAVARALEETELRRERRAADDALATTGRLFEAVFVNARDAMLIVDHSRQIVDANPAAAEIFARTRPELAELRIEELVPGASRTAAASTWERLLSAGCERGELEFLHADGTLIVTEYTAAADFSPGRHMLVMRDIRQRRAAEAEVKRRNAQQRAIADLGEQALREPSVDALRGAAVACVAATLGVEIAWILELRAGEGAFAVQAELGLGNMRTGVRIPYGPPASSQASYTVRREDPVLVEDYEHETRFARAPILRDSGVRSALSVHIRGPEEPFGVLEAASRRARAFDVHDANFLAAISNILADALQRTQTEQRTHERSLHDELTGLANRALLFDRLAIGLARTKRLGTRLAVAFVDLDHFKSLNDALGHLAADELLTQVGARLERAMRDTDTVARFGGDEFVVLCEDLADDAEAETVAARVASIFDSPFSLTNEPHTLSASIGVALSGAHTGNGEALLRDADAAMYQSKETGRGKWTLATEAMRAAIVERVETKRALERAIDNDELVLHYQPIVALDGGGICAVEALVRWNDPDRGLMLPDAFISLAEESDLILRLGDWVLRAACQQARLWRAELGDTAPLPVHVNFSARQVAQINLPELVRKIMKQTGVSPSDIALEITETALLERSGAPIATLQELKRMGLLVVLDDFGTGYSSLAYLERFPIDTLKIDRSFIAPLDGAITQAPIVTAIVGMAHALEVGAIAEGVETAEQAAAVSALGCSRAQGYYFARPGPAEQITQLTRDETLAERAAAASALGPPTADTTAAAQRFAVQRHAGDGLGAGEPVPT
jgi:diguanylate cyclase (GGDEF)-like protein/PAS domain S-box-containing protein